jgi:hypothetical protein
LSGVLLTDGTAASEFTPMRDDQVPAGTLPAPAISRRTFSRNDVLSLFAEIYTRAAETGGRSVEAMTTLTSEDGTAVFSSRESLGSAASPGVRGSRVPITKQIPLKDLSPGTYTLRVEARTLGGSTRPAARETNVTIK